jgi:hypothetical protein
LKKPARLLARWVDRTKTVMHVGRHTARVPARTAQRDGDLARAVATSLVRNSPPMRKTLASPDDDDELAWAMSHLGPPGVSCCRLHPTAPVVRGAYCIPCSKITIGMA